MAYQCFCSTLMFKKKKRATVCLLYKNKRDYNEYGDVLQGGLGTIAWKNARLLLIVLLRIAKFCKLIHRYMCFCNIIHNSAVFNAFLNSSFCIQFNRSSNKIPLQHRFG